MNRRLFIILVLILIVLYVIGAGVGIRNTSGDNDDDSDIEEQLKAFQTPPAWMDSISQRLTFDIGLGDITIEDEDNCTIDAGAEAPRLRLVDDCELSISDIGLNPISRRLRLRLVSAGEGDELSLELEQDARLTVKVQMTPLPPTVTPDAQSTSTATPDDDVRLTIYRAGGTLTIEGDCSDTTPCVLLLNP